MVRVTWRAWALPAVVSAAIALGLSLAGCGGGGSTAVTAAGNRGVYPPDSAPFGKTYGAWAAAWWQWGLAVPLADNPFLDQTGEKQAMGQPGGPVWFLSGTTGGSVERTCVVPAGKAILIPPVNSIFARPVDGTTDEEIRSAVIRWVDDVAEVEVRVDGVALEGLDRHRFLSPFFEFTMPQPPDALADVYAGTHRAISDGYWVMLEPLSPGPHTLFSRGKVVKQSTGTGLSEFESKVTYHLTVQ